MLSELLNVGGGFLLSLFAFALPAVVWFGMATAFRHLDRARERELNIFRMLAENHWLDQQTKKEEK